MKNFILVVLLVFAGKYVFAQSTLQVSIKKCKQESNFAYLAEFEVFRDGVLVKTVKPERENIQTLNNLKYGNYRIEYKSSFQRIEAINIELTESKTYRIDLCLDYFDHASDPHETFISCLKNGERYSIQLLSHGCFHSSEEMMWICKELDKYYITFKGKKTELSGKDVKAIEHFEKELNSKWSYGCTTRDTYVLKYKKEEVRITDGSCSWNGGYYLKEALGLLESVE